MSDIVARILQWIARAAGIQPLPSPPAPPPPPKPADPLEQIKTFARLAPEPHGANAGDTLQHSIILAIDERGRVTQMIAGHITNGVWQVIPAGRSEIERVMQLREVEDLPPIVPEGIK